MTPSRPASGPASRAARSSLGTAASRYRRPSALETGQRTLLASPAYLGALLAHAVALLLLSLWTFAVYTQERNVEVTAKLGVSADVELDDADDQDLTDALLQQVETELDQAAEVDTDAFYEEAFGDTLGANAGERLVGLAGGGGLGRGGNADRDGLLRVLRGSLGSDDLLVVAGAYDRVQDVLQVLKLPHRTVSFSRFEQEELDPARQVLIVNCHSKPFSRQGRAKVRRFVQAGGYVFSSDWALRNLLKDTFGEAITQRGTTSDQITVPISAPADSAESPLLKSLFRDPSRPLYWQVDGVSDIVGWTRYMQVLVEAPSLPRCKIVACTFALGEQGVVDPEHVEPGHGRVLHVLSHFIHQLDAAGDGYALQQLLLNFVLEKVGAQRAAGLDTDRGFEGRLQAASKALADGEAGGGLAATQLQLEELLEELEGTTGGRRDTSLIAETKALLVEVAFLQGDHADVLLLVADYRASIPRGQEPSQRALHAGRLSRHSLVLREAAACLSPQAEPGARRRAEIALARHVDQLRDERRSGPLGEEIDRMVFEAGELRQRLAFGQDPDAAIEAALREFTAGAPEGEVSSGEWRLGLALLQRAVGHYQATARGEHDRFEAGARDEAAFAERRFGSRLGGRRGKTLAQLREQVSLARIQALLVLGRELQVLAEIEALGPSHPEAAALQSVERIALARLVQDDRANGDQRARLARLYGSALDRGEGPQGLEALAVGELLLGCGAPDVARGYFEEAVGGALPTAAAVRARLHLSRLALDAGQADQAQLHLATIPSEAAQRLDVRRARCAVWRQRGQAERALEEYLKIMRALADERPPELYEVALEACRSYLELGRRQEAKDFLEGLRRMDPRLGGEGELKDRVIDMMRELDRS